MAASDLRRGAAGDARPAARDPALARLPARAAVLDAAPTNDAVISDGTMQQPAKFPLLMGL
jgi:hypothetical protein